MYFPQAPRDGVLRPVPKRPSLTRNPPGTVAPSGADMTTIANTTRREFTFHERLENLR
jgi:hypothetical protein